MTTVDGSQLVKHLIVGAGFAGLWPRTTFAFGSLLSSFDVAAYGVQAPAPSPEDAIK